MGNNEKLNINQHTKVLIPAERHNFSVDKRLLIPFTNGDKIGFMNKDGVEVVKPLYTMYYDDCYDESDYTRVTIDYQYGYVRSGGKVACYKRPLFGLINSKGEYIFEPSFFGMAPSIGNKNIYTVQKQDFQYGVISVDGTEIVPFGKYNWIDGFDKGLARVIIPNGQKENENKWGLIDETGKEILPVMYDYIWPFYCRNRFSTKLVKGDFTQNIVLSNLLNRSETHHKDSNDYSEQNDYGTHYGEYAGYYAQDVEGYSDDVIDDAFEGDPDAYWNID